MPTVYPRLVRGPLSPNGWAAVCVALALAALVPAEAAQPRLRSIANGLSRPLGLAHAGDGSGRLFIVEQTGQIRVRKGKRLLSAPFLDLSDRVPCCREQGLLGLVFHPGYSENGFFYVSYTDPQGDSVISRFSVSEDPDRADPESEAVILAFDQPGVTHNNGHLAFGPDGLLYIGAGDGGGAGDEDNNAQNLGTLLGKILRIDVDRGAPYAIPPDNPFVGEPGAQDEIWAYGLRNPWRFSFDRLTGDLFIGDVGQTDWEEVDRQPAASRGGENYGWRRMEGAHCFNPPVDCEDPSLTLPILEYSHEEGCSVTGGFRYRGSRLVEHFGTYVFGDFCSGRVWGAVPDGSGGWARSTLLDSSRLISSFGEDQSGELYLVDLGGAVLRFVGNLVFAVDHESGDTAGWSAARGGVEVVEPGLNQTAFALSVPVDGTATASFVRSRKPKREKAVRVGFRLDADRVDLDGGEVTILRLKGKGRSHVELTLEQRKKKYWVHLYARGDAGGFREIGRTRVPRRAETHLQIEWRRASGAGAADGLARLYRDGEPRAEALDLDNGGQRVDGVWLGLPDGSAELDASGRFLVDEFAMTP